MSLKNLVFTKISHKGNDIFNFKINKQRIGKVEHILDTTVNNKINLHEADKLLIEKENLK